VSATPKSSPPYSHILFDCDSTLSSIEGIEDLAGEHAEQISALTDRAMNGEVPLEDVYGARLDLIRPDLEQLDAVGERYIETALPHAHELIAALHSLGKEVHIISGGLLHPVAMLAEDLGVDAARVHAVCTKHTDEGSYIDFDRTSPLARAGGKPEWIAELFPELAQRSCDDASPASTRLALIGDGATDLEAAPLCERFIAFGGVHKREAVFAGADECCDKADFAGLLALLVSGHEVDILRRDVAFHSLIAQATLYGGI
jgi:phosphoserine phosphatase